MSSGIFNYITVISIIHKRELAEREQLFSFLQFMTGKEVTNENYEKLVDICKPNLALQFECLNANEIKLAFVALDFLLDRDDAQKNQFEIVNDWLLRNRSLFKCKDMVSAESLPCDNRSKKTSGQYKAFLKFREQLYSAK